MTWFPKEVAFFCSIAVAIALGLIAYKCTDRSFEAKDYDDTLIQVDTAISIKKKLVKGKEYDQEDLDARIRHIKKDLSQDFSSQGRNERRINSEISDLIDDIAKIPNNKPYDISKQRRQNGIEAIERLESRLNAISDHIAF
jgi:septal ring factor EnvC (AmiA/AmiB activator)